MQAASLTSLHLESEFPAFGNPYDSRRSESALIDSSQVAARIVEMVIERCRQPIWTLAASVALVASGLVLLWSGFSILVIGLIVSAR